MRVSDANRFDTMKWQIERTGTDVDRAMERLSTGRRINRLSDDPDRAVLAERLSAEYEAIETYTRAADNARSWLSAQDTALQDGMSVLQRARELAVAAASTQSPEAREGLAVELESLRRQLLDIANTTFDGRSVFGGFAGRAVDDSGAAAAFVGDGGQVQRRVSDTLVLTVNMSGADVFGFSGGDDVFGVMDELITATRSGDTAAISGTVLDRLIARSDDVGQALGAVGARTNVVERTITTATARRDEVRAYRSSFVDADLAESTLELTQAETAYQAVLAATMRLQEPSLVDFLR